jgi:zinc transport system substrate-binding protein
MFKKFMKFFSIIAIILCFTSCEKASFKENTNEDNNEKIQVIVTFNPLKEFAMAIGKDKIEVKTLVPEGTEPHDFEPKIKDLKQIHNCKVFIYNGLNMESWLKKCKDSIDNKDIIFVDSSKNIDAIKINNSYDPHIWLSLLNAKIQANNIKEALIKVDSKNKDFYEKNYKDFSNNVDDLYNDYKEKFNTVENKKFVTGHAAFGYFCRDFGLEQNSIEDVFSSGEPSANKMKELIDYCKQNKIKTIFLEDMVSPKVSETLAKEVGAKTVKIYTIESKEDNKNYIESMKDNLEKVYKSLKK